MSAPFSGAGAGSWVNWAGNQHAHPRQVVWPVDAAELSRTVIEAADRQFEVKVVGAGHSFSSIGLTDGVQVRLDRLSGLVRVDNETDQVTVLGGTRLHDLNLLLDGYGLALANLGDIDQQTVAGAISTGTHGTGHRLGGLAAQVRGLTMIMSDGGTLHCSADEHADIFSAAPVGLGALGIITEVTLQCVPAFTLRAVERPERLDVVLDHLQEWSTTDDHFEFYWFPHTDRTLIKRNNRTTEPIRPVPGWRSGLEDEFLSNRVFEWTNRLAAANPRLIPRINAVAARALTAREYRDVSYRVFTSPRRVRFVESEYAVPPESVVPILTELRNWLNRHDHRIAFPVEVRFAAADDIWLSPGFQRDNGYLAVHQYFRLDYRPYFAAFESIVGEHQGRPHWGKLHSLGATRLAELYPRHRDFVAMRNQLDPDRVFVNPYLDQVLGV